MVAQDVTAGLVDVGLLLAQLDLGVAVFKVIGVGILEGDGDVALGVEVAPVAVGFVIGQDQAIRGLVNIGAVVVPAVLQRDHHIAGLVDDAVLLGLRVLHPGHTLVELSGEIELRLDDHLAGLVDVAVALIVPPVRQLGLGRSQTLGKVLDLIKGPAGNLVAVSVQIGIAAIGFFHGQHTIGIDLIVEALLIPFQGFDYCDLRR